MKNIITTLILILLCTSCFVHKGQNLNNGQCRPKNPNFKLLRVSFSETNKLAFNKIYIANDKTNAVGYGFYSDGRIIYLHSKDGFMLRAEDVIGKTWNNAPAIGYWRVEGSRIRTEYFSCSNSGVYIRKQGEIKGDTIIFERDCGTSNPFKTVKCPEKYILSDMSFE